MNLNRYIVVMTEHSESFDDIPRLLNSFQTKEEADNYVEKCVRESCNEFKDEEVIGTGVVRSYKTDGTPDYGCVWTVIDTDSEMGFPTIDNAQ